METLIIVALVLWFIPTIVAVERKHQSALAIFLFNLFFGWTGVCWLLALIWACTGNTQANMTQLVMSTRLLGRRRQGRRFCLSLSPLPRFRRTELPKRWTGFTPSTSLNRKGSLRRAFSPRLRGTAGRGCLRAIWRSPPESQGRPAASFRLHTSSLNHRSRNAGALEVIVTECTGTSGCFTTLSSAARASSIDLNVRVTGAATYPPET